MQLFKALIGKSKKKADGSVPSHARLKKSIMYACIAFFVTAVVFVGITFSGGSQAGLIEVSGSAFLFVIFLHILKILIPESSGRIITALSVIIAVMLVYANFSLQRNKNREYTFRDLLVGDLLAKKLIGKQENLPEQRLAERFETLIPGEFAKTKTEKDTIESPFERPEKDLMGQPVTLPPGSLGTVFMRKERAHPFDIPKDAMNYKLEVAIKEGLMKDGTRIVTAGFMARLDSFAEQITSPQITAPMHLPSAVPIADKRIIQSVYSKPEIPSDVLKSEIQPAKPEEHVEVETGRQVEENLQRQEK